MKLGVTTLGKYKLGEALPPGKTGQSHLATRKDDNQNGDASVVVKILRPGLRFDPMVQTSFFSELEAVAALEHPHIVRLVDFGENAEHYHVVHERVAGGSLAAWLQRETRNGAIPDVSLALELMRQIAEALSFAHRKGVVHGQIEPENILVLEINQRQSAKLGDFALARLCAKGDEDAAWLNDPRCISPDHLLSMDFTVGAPSDIYSLGVVMYQAFTGVVPFQVRDTGEAAIKHVYEQPRAPRELVPNLAPELEAVVLQCLGKRPAERPTSDGLRDALQGIQERLYPSLKATQILGPSAGVSAPTIAPPEGRCEQARITVVDAAGQVLEVRELRVGNFTVGRQEHNTLVLDAPTVSRHHARIEHDGLEVRLTDLSSNGTWLSGAGLAGSGLSAGGRLPFQAPTVWPWRGVVQVGPYWLRLEQPSTMQEPSRIVVMPERERLELTPGTSTTLRVTLANLGVLVDHFNLEVVGVPSAWVVAPSNVQLNPGVQQPLTLEINVPRHSEAVAGDRAVQIRARSRQNPNEFGQANATWTVLPFFALRLHARPGLRSARRMATFGAQIINEGNAPLDVSLRAVDGKNNLFLAFGAQKPKVQLPPGAKGVLLRWGQMLAYPFVMALRTIIESTIGPTWRRAARINQDLKTLVGQDDGTPQIKSRAVALQEPQVPQSELRRVAPGQTETVPVHAWGAWRLVGPAIERDFNLELLSALPETRWQDRVTSFRDVKSSTATLRHTALLPWWLLPLVAGAVALLAYFFVIRAPSIERLRSEPVRVKAGQPFTLLCDVTGSFALGLRVGENKIFAPKTPNTCAFDLGKSNAFSAYVIEARNLLPMFGFGITRKAVNIDPYRDPKPATLESFGIVGGTTTFNLIEGQKRGVQFSCRGQYIKQLELDAPQGTRTYAGCAELAKDRFELDAPGELRFSLDAMGEAGSAKPLAKRIVLRVVAAKPLVRLIAAPQTIVKGRDEKVILSYAVENAAQAQISDVGEVNGTDTKEIPAPNESKTYTLTARNFEVQRSVSVTVNVLEPVVQPKTIEVPKPAPAVAVAAPPAPAPLPQATPQAVKASPQPAPAPVLPKPAPVAAQPTAPVKPKPAPANLAPSKPATQPVVVPPTPQAPKPQAPKPAAPSERWTLYHTNFGQLELSDQNRIRYNDALGGTRSDGLVAQREGREWSAQLPDQSPVVLSFNSSQSRFEGTARRYGKWCGATEGTPFPKNCSFAGQWRVRIAGQECNLTMTRISNKVSGTLCQGQDRLQLGTTSLVLENGKATLAGYFQRGARFETYEITLEEYDGKQFVGVLVASDGSNQTWCGWREGQAPPAGCGP